MCRRGIPCDSGHLQRSVHGAYAQCAAGEIGNIRAETAHFLRERMDFETLYQMCMDGTVQDAKTVAAVLKVKLLLKN